MWWRRWIHPTKSRGWLLVQGGYRGYGCSGCRECIAMWRTMEEYIGWAYFQDVGSLWRDRIFPVTMSSWFHTHWCRHGKKWGAVRYLITWSCLITDFSQGKISISSCHKALAGFQQPSWHWVWYWMQVWWYSASVPSQRADKDQDVSYAGWIILQTCSQPSLSASTSWNISQGLGSQGSWDTGVFFFKVKCFGWWYPLH